MLRSALSLLLLPALVLPGAARRTEIYDDAGVMAVEIAWIDDAEVRWRAGGHDELGVALESIFESFAFIEQQRWQEAAAVLVAARAVLEGSDEPLLALIASTRSVALSQTADGVSLAADEARRAIALGTDPEFVAVNQLNLSIQLAQLGPLEDFVAACEPLTDWLAAEWMASPPAVLCLNYVAAARFTDGDLPEARRIWERSAELIDLLAGPESPDSGVIAGNLGRVALLQQRYEEAYALFEEARARMEADGNPQAWQYYPFLADAAVGMGGLPRAEELYRALLAAHEEVYGADSTLVEMDLGSLASVVQKQGRYDEAEALLRRAVRIGEAHRADSPLHLATSLAELASLYTETGEYAQGGERFEEALQIQIDHAGPDSVAVAAVRTNYGSLLRETGRYAEAKLQYEHALRIYEAELGDHRYVATALTNLAGLLQHLGDHEGALPKLERAVAIYERTVGPEHEWTATGLNNLATAKMEAGDLEGAASLLVRAIEVLTATLGADHPGTLAGRRNLAEIYTTQERWAEARDEYASLLRLQAPRLGEAHPAVGQTRGRLAVLLWNLEEHDEAFAQASRGLDTLREALGDFHPETANAWAQWADFFRHTDEREEVRFAAARAYDGAMMGIVPLLDVTSERERLAMVGAIRTKVELMLSIYDQPGDELLLYSVVLGWKSIVLRTLAMQRRALLASREPALAERLEELTAVRGELATWTFSVPEPGAVEARRAEVAALTARKEAIERSLAQASAQFEHQMEQVEIDPAAVCRALARDEAIVDILRFDYYPMAETVEVEETGAIYLAFVLRGGQCEQPVRVPLGPAGLIDQAVVRYRRRVASPTQSAAAGRYARTLRELVWDPLEEALDGRTRIRLVPDGSLNAVPFAALQGEDGRYLIEDFEISYLDSAMAMLQPRVRVTGRGHLVIGGVAYDEPQALAVAEPATDAPATLRSRGVRGLDGFAYLPNTALEADDVAASLGRGREEVVRSGGAEATEGFLREHAPGKRFIHLATHGFFATGADRSELEGAQLNPMLLSGIVLAGVNDRSAVRRGDDDGVLTAEEVVSLDLRGTELVTLSACETGLGEVADGEGVMGLRRAFALAGARALVISLWQVPDAETRELMIRFYDNLGTSRRADPSEALREAQLALIARLRAETGAAPAFFWAAFVVSGG
jgi:CHAT domain-containing protein/Tfp pilus assembly protein PilF